MKQNITGTPKAARLILILAAVFALVISAGSMVFIHLLNLENFPRYDRPKYAGYVQFSDLPEGAYTVVHFPSGKNSLAGYIFGAENTRGLVVIAPGRGAGGEKYLAETQFFVDHGWRVFSFDYTGSFASEGDSTVGLPQSRIDLEAALAYLRAQPEMQDLPVVLWGHSWGGYAVAAVRADHTEITAVASIASYNTPLGLTDEYVRAEIGPLGAVLYPFEWAYQTARFGASAGSSAVEGINRAAVPVMIVHDRADEAIAYDGASIIAQRARITNPNVVYITRDTSNGSGHMDLLRSQAAIEYKNQKNREFKALYEQYQGTIPDAELAAYYAGVDHFQVSELDAEIMNTIHTFFESALLQAAKSE